MVQKKSNTVFNSGTTQRVTNGKPSFRYWNYFYQDDQCNRITWHLPLRRYFFSPFRPVDQRLADFVNFIIQELGFRELSGFLGELPGRNGRYEREMTIITSTNRKKRWQLSSLLENLRLDIQRDDGDFIEKSQYSPLHLSVLEYGLDDVIKELDVKITDMGASKKGSVFSMFDKVIPIKHDISHDRLSFSPTPSASHQPSTTKTAKNKTQYTTKADPKLLNETIMTLHSKKRNKKKRRRKRKKTKNHPAAKATTACESSEIRLGECDSDYVNSDSTTASKEVALKALQIHISGANADTDARDYTIKTPIKRFTIRPYNAPRVALSKGKGSGKGKWIRSVCGISNSSRDLKRDFYEARLSIWGGKSDDSSGTGHKEGYYDHDSSYSHTAIPLDESDNQDAENCMYNLPGESTLFVRNFILGDYIIDNR